MNQKQIPIFLYLPARNYVYELYYEKWERKLVYLTQLIYEKNKSFANKWISGLFMQLKLENIGKQGIP